MKKVLTFLVITIALVFNLFSDVNFASADNFEYAQIQQAYNPPANLEDEEIVEDGEIEQGEDEEISDDSVFEDPEFENEKEFTE